MIKRSLFLAAALGATLVVAACGSSSSSSSSTSSSATGNAGTQPVHATLKVALPGGGPVTTPIYLADAKGLFQKEGLKVDISDGNGSNTPVLVVSGQADIGMLGTVAPLIVASKGKSTTIIYNQVGNANGGVVAAPPSVHSLEDLKSVKNCKIATLAPGSSTYGWAQVLVTDLGLPCEVVPYSTVPVALGSVLAGRANAMVAALQPIETAVTSGKLHLLVDTRKPADREKYYGSSASVPEGTLFGLTDNFKSKAPAIAAFLKAVNEALQLMPTLSTNELAAILRKYPAFASLPRSVLNQSIIDSLPYVAPNAGYISQQNWADGLKVYSKWGVKGFDASAPVNSYAQRIDMSYYDDGIGKPQQ